MSFLSFDEKAWDKVRPFAIKKTGVSEAIRAFEKALPKTLDDLQTSAACQMAEQLLGTVAEKLEGAKARFDKNKHDKEIKKVTVWLSEVALRRKMITTHSGKLHDQYQQQIMQANAAMDPFIERAEEALSTARKLASKLADQSKEALLAGARGDTDAVLECKNFAAEAKLKMDRLLEDARKLHPDAEKAAQAKMPPKEVLDAGHLDTIKSVSARCSSIGVTVKEKIGFYAEQFQASFESITFTGTRTEGLHEKFAKLVEADIEACQTLVAPVHKGQPGILTDLEQANNRLKSALQQDNPQDKARLLGEAGKWTADAIGKITTMQTLVNKMSKTLTSKVKGYPDFFAEDRERFKRQHDALDELDEYAVTSTEKLNQLLVRAKELGRQIVQAKT